MPGIDGGPGRRDALIIAAGRYQDPSFAALRSPSQDAAEFAEVLSDRAIGGFDARVLLDEPGHLLREEIDGFLAERRPEDLLVLYLSCHGIKDVDGLLHFAVSTTKFSRLASTGISASFVHEQIDRCKARKILLLLDCCYSGAYPKGHRPKAKSRAEIKPFDGRGRAVITSCTDLQYAFEVDTQKVSGTAGSSVFTAALVEGLRTGRADRDGDGQVSIDELYAYVFDRVRQTTPHQTPEKIWGEIRGDFIIAANPRPPACPAATTTQTTGHDRQPATTRRVLLGLATATAAGLAITGWDLAHQNPTTRRPNPATTPIPLWSHPLGDRSQLAWWGSAVSRDILYASTASKLYALSASDGELIWSVSANLSMGIAFSDGDIFTWSNGITDSHPFGLRASNGHRTWHSPVGLTGPMAGPVVSGDVVCVAGGNGKVYALRASDGIEIWNSSSSAGVPVGMAATADFICVAGANSAGTTGNVCAMRLSDGASLWNTSIGEAPASGQAVAGDMVYVASSSGRSTSYGQIYAVRASDGAKVWSFGADWMLQAGGVVYGVTGEQLYALRATDGKRLWSFPGVWTRFFAGPFTLPAAGSLIDVAGDVVYAADGHGDVHALRVSSGKKLWSFATGSPVAAIVWASGVVYIASNNLYALNATKGTQIWSIPVDVEEYGAMFIAGGVLYAGSVTGVHALRV